MQLLAAWSPEFVMLMILPLLEYFPRPSPHWFEVCNKLLMCRLLNLFLILASHPHLSASSFANIRARMVRASVTILRTFNPEAEVVALQLDILQHLACAVLVSIMTQSQECLIGVKQELGEWGRTLGKPVHVCSQLGTQSASQFRFMSDSGSAATALQMLFF